MSILASQLTGMDSKNTEIGFVNHFSSIAPRMKHQTVILRILAELWPVDGPTPGDGKCVYPGIAKRETARLNVSGKKNNELEPESQTPEDIEAMKNYFFKEGFQEFGESMYEDKISYIHCGDNCKQPAANSLSMEVRGDETIDLIKVFAVLIGFLFLRYIFPRVQSIRATPETKTEAEAEAEHNNQMDTLRVYNRRNADLGNELLDWHDKRDKLLEIKNSFKNHHLTAMSDWERDETAEDWDYVTEYETMMDYMDDCILHHGPDPFTDAEDGEESPQNTLLPDPSEKLRNAAYNIQECLDCFGTENAIIDLLDNHVFEMTNSTELSISEMLPNIIKEMQKIIRYMNPYNNGVVNTSYIEHKPLTEFLHQLAYLGTLLVYHKNSQCILNDNQKCNNVAAKTEWDQYTRDLTRINQEKVSKIENKKSKGSEVDFEWFWKRVSKTTKKTWIMQLANGKHELVSKETCKKMFLKLQCVYTKEEYEKLPEESKLILRICRKFPEKDRNDESHLRFCLGITQRFIDDELPFVKHEQRTQLESNIQHLLKIVNHHMTAGKKEISQWEYKIQHDCIMILRRMVYTLCNRSDKTLFLRCPGMDRVSGI